MSDFNISFKDQEILNFFAALTLFITSLGQLLGIIVDILKAISSLIPQISLYLSSQTSFFNSVTSSLIQPLKKLIDGLYCKMYKCSTYCKNNPDYKDCNDCQYVLAYNPFVTKDCDPCKANNPCNTSCNTSCNNPCNTSCNIPCNTSCKNPSKENNHCKEKDKKCNK